MRERLLEEDVRRTIDYWLEHFAIGGDLGRLELPLPQLRKGARSLEASAKEMQSRIRGQVPTELEDSIVVRTFKRGKQTGLTIEYDDRAESFVYIAIEYPKRK